MPYSEFIYEPSDINDEMFLSKVPLEIIEESIQNQFINPWEYRKKDYVQTVITKYVISKDNMVEDELEDLERLNEDFISFMLRMFDIYLDIGVNDIDILEMDDQHELIHLTYRFFIKNMKKNFVNLIINYINENKSELYDDLPKKKDVTSLHFKSEIDNEEDATILSNLSTIVNHILSIDFGVDEFLDLCQGDSNTLENEFVRKKFEDFTLVGNFIEKYTDMVGEDFKIDLESKIRNRILKKYPIRKKVKKEEE